MVWAELANGELLDAAEAAFDVLTTTDQNLRHQQNLSGRRLAILVLPTTSWPVIQNRAAEVADALKQLRPGDSRTLVTPYPGTHQPVEAAKPRSKSQWRSPYFVFTTSATNIWRFRFRSFMNSQGYWRVWGR
jgi:hypothetical protein